MHYDKQAICQIVSNHLKSYRKNNNITQEKMSENLNISPRTYANIEHCQHCLSGHTLVMFLIKLSDTEILKMIEDLKDVIINEE